MRQILLLLLFISTVAIFSQDLDRLPIRERNKILREIAKKTIFKYGPGYYREYKKVIIEEKKVSKHNSGNIANEGRKYYFVGYLYDKKGEQLDLEYAAQVFIWADTEKAFQVHFGNGFGLLELDKRESNNRVPYQSVQTNYASMDDYQVRWVENPTIAQQDSLQKVQDELWIKYEEKEKQLRIEHIRSDSLKEVEIMKKYGIEY